MGCNILNANGVRAARERWEGKIGRHAGRGEGVRW